MKNFLLQLAKTPWLGRQLTKLTGYIGATLSVLLSKAHVVIDGVERDLLTGDQEAAIIAGVLAIVAALLELGMSYGKHILADGGKVTKRIEE